jgi:hypothetical protein
MSIAAFEPRSHKCHERTLLAHRFCLVEQCLESARKHRPIKRDNHLPQRLVVCLGHRYLR